MVDAVAQQRAGVGAQDLEQRQVGVARDQRRHRRAGLVERVAKAFVPAVAQRLVDAAEAVVPQPRQLLAWRRGDALGRAQRLVEVDQGAALEQRVELVAAADELVACQQQGAVGVAHVERQRRTDADAVAQRG